MCTTNASRKNLNTRYSKSIISTLVESDLPKIVTSLPSALKAAAADLMQAPIPSTLSPPGSALSTYPLHPGVQKRAAPTSCEEKHAVVWAISIPLGDYVAREYVQCDG